MFLFLGGDFTRGDGTGGMREYFYISLFLVLFRSSWFIITFTGDPDLNIIHNIPILPVYY